jgi:hypothetical protein
VPKPKKTEYRRALEFAAILAGAGVIFAGLSLWRGHGSRAAIFAGAGLGSLALALAVRPLWLAFFRLWMKLAEGMGWVMTRVLLTLFYFLVLTPFGLVRRLMGRPTLDTTWRTGKGSYWVDKEPVPSTIERYMKRY